MKTHRRVTALFVAFAFLTLLQVSAMPLRADQSPDRGGAAVTTPEQGPNYIEEEGTGGSAGKKSIMPVILIGLGVAAVAAILILVVFKTKYDIVGTWTVTDTILSKTLTITFSGSKSSGTLTIKEYIDTGTYTVDGKNVHFEFSAAGYNYKFVYDGTFSSKDKANGTVKYLVANVEKDSGTWNGTKSSSTTGSGLLPQSVPTAPVRE